MSWTLSRDQLRVATSAEVRSISSSSDNEIRDLQRRCDARLRFEEERTVRALLPPETADKHLQVLSRDRLQDAVLHFLTSEGEAFISRSADNPAARELRAILDRVGRSRLESELRARLAAGELALFMRGAIFGAAIGASSVFVAVLAWLQS